MRTRSELVTWVREQISRAMISAPHLVAPGGGAFMVHGTIGEVSYLTIDGDAYVEVDAWDPLPGSFEKRTGPSAARHVFFYGMKMYPELREWLPERTTSDSHCSPCGGTGWRQHGEHTVGCDQCAGFGWLITIDAAGPVSKQQR